MARYRMSKEQVLEVVEMRRQGYSFTVIGRYFQKDHTTIIYHCQKAGLGKGGKATLVDDLNYPETIIRPRKIYREDGEVINSGKNYADYLAEEQKRDWKKRKDIAAPGGDSYSQYY